MDSQIYDAVNKIDIAKELGKCYTDYALSVIVSRALPDVRDGLKPVHRRILYAMKEGGYTSDKPFRKSARAVGDVMGKYHPHGDSAIYMALVRMAQSFSMSVPLIHGQGNFGSIDGDNPAAMRYTESKLAKQASLLIDDIDKETVAFQPNYDETLLEPSVLPARFPNILVNGSEGIAVGLATSIPPHNASETIHACLALIEDPAISVSGLMSHIPGPDFPTGGIIMGRGGIKQAYETGHGSIVVRARHVMEDIGKGRKAIVFTEIPFQVNKARLHEKIVELAREGKIMGISEVRDETDRDGVRLVIEIKRDADENMVLAQIFTYTEAESRFSANMNVLHQGRPAMMNLKQMLEAFIDFRRDVIRRRTAYELRKARERAHIVIGQAAALEQIDKIIAIIRAAGDPNQAKSVLMATDLDVSAIKEIILLADPKITFIERRGKTYYRLSEAQAKAILDLRLHRLTALERDKLSADAHDLAAQIKRFIDILSNESVLTGVLCDELRDVETKLDGERRTAIEDAEADIEMEDLIPREDMVVTITHGGYVKRVPLAAYRTQNHGGKGRNGMDTKDDDFVTQVISASTHTPILVFTDRGIAYRLKVYQLPEGAPTGRGRPIVNVLPQLDRGERIVAVLPAPEDEAEWENLTIAFATESGDVRRNKLSDFANIRKSGLIAMKLEDKDGNVTDRLVAVMSCESDKHDIMLSTANGMVIRFPASDIRIFAGRSSTGVRGINLARGDKVISAITLTHIDAEPGEFHAYLSHAGGKQRDDAPIDAEAAIALSDMRVAELKALEQMILTITSNGFGKRSSSFAYRITHRGGKGVRDRSSNDKVGEQVRSVVVDDKTEIVLVTNGGQLIRMPTDRIRVTGRGAAGVRLIRLPTTEQVVSVATIDQSEPAIESETPDMFAGADQNIENAV